MASFYDSNCSMSGKGSLAETQYHESCRQNLSDVKSETEVFLKIYTVFTKLFSIYSGMEWV